MCLSVWANSVCMYYRKYVWVCKCICKTVSVCLCVCQWIYLPPFFLVLPWLKRKEIKSIIFVFKTCIDANVMLGFQMRYYKGHMLLSANFISLYFLYQSEALVFLTLSYGILSPALSQHDCPCISSLLSREGEPPGLLKKDNYFSEWKKKTTTGTW